MRAIAMAMVGGLGLVLAGSGLAMAAGDSGGGSEPSPTVQNCKKGEIWDKKTGKCIKAQSGLDQDSVYEAGRDLALAGRYEEAIIILSLADDKDDKRVLNYLGYANRKLGRVLVGLGYYREALRIDPDYVLVREYMGEALVEMGDLAGAKAQLAEIAARCGTTCDTYQSLSETVATAGG
ncbi:tetratricopeptide repeat protein [Pannonibacter carbonis]|uniref:tetratricopeptide repeat protein n=1 Tax=Pannonibacter carbonis TaxID=2067569 RepID=UPI0018E53C0D